jgi:hypothetical protein
MIQIPYAHAMLRFAQTGELERMSTTAREEARRLSTSRNSGPGSEAARDEARAAVGQGGNVASGSAVDDTPIAAPRRNSICKSEWFLISRI